MAFVDGAAEVAHERPVSAGDRAAKTPSWQILLVIASIAAGLFIAGCDDQVDARRAWDNTPGLGWGFTFVIPKGAKRLEPRVTPTFRAAVGEGLLEAHYDIGFIDAGTVFTPSHVLAPLLDRLSESAFVGIRVPHEPPTYTASTISSATARLYYFDEAQQRTIQRPITLTRHTENTGVLNHRYPITDGRSHWEAWWLSPGDRLPHPPGAFRNVQVSIDVYVTFPGGDIGPCPGCIIDVVLSNGAIFLGPFPQKVDYFGSNLASQREGLAQFKGCGTYDENIMLIWKPGQPYTVTHCLHNNDKITHTYDLRMSSSQGWDYTYLVEDVTGNVGLVPLTSTRVTLAANLGFGGNRLAILGVYTPGAMISTTVQETFTLTATSTLSPTQVHARAETLVFGRDYDLLAGVVTGTQRAFLPLIARGRQD